MLPRASSIMTAAATTYPDQIGSGDRLLAMLHNVDNAFSQFVFMPRFLHPFAHGPYIFFNKADTFF